MKPKQWTDLYAKTWPDELKAIMTTNRQSNLKLHFYYGTKLKNTKSIVVYQIIKHQKNSKDDISEEQAV